MATLAVAFGGLVTGDRLLSAIPIDSETWLSIVFLALPATAGAMIALSWAQSRISAARTAIILTLEPVAAAGTAVVLGAELGLRTLVGGGGGGDDHRRSGSPLAGIPPTAADTGSASSAESGPPAATGPHRR